VARIPREDRREDLEVTRGVERRPESRFEKGERERPQPFLRLAPPATLAVEDEPTRDQHADEDGRAHAQAHGAPGEQLLHDL